MENVMQKTADIFWQTHFPELIGQTVTERKALDMDFWDKLQTILDNTDIDTIYAVLLSNLAMRVETTDMHTRIKRMTKWTWDDKRE